MKEEKKDTEVVVLLDIRHDSIQWNYVSGVSPIPISTDALTIHFVP